MNLPRPSHAGGVTAVLRAQMLIAAKDARWSATRVTRRHPSGTFTQRERAEGARECADLCDFAPVSYLTLDHDGMHLSQRLAELLGGRITCAREHRRGSTGMLALFWP